jgi:hypothetical protein
LEIVVPSSSTLGETVALAEREMRRRRRWLGKETDEGERDMEAEEEREGVATKDRVEGSVVAIATKAKR